MLLALSLFGEFFRPFLNARTALNATICQVRGRCYAAWHRLWMHSSLLGRWQGWEEEGKQATCARTHDVSEFSWNSLFVQGHDR